MSTKELVSNKRAYFNYEILETFEAGLVLLGTEIKSLRDQGGTIQEAYIRLIEGELFLVGASIAPYKYGNLFNHEERRERKLLMHKREITRIASKVAEKGVTVIPLSLYLKEGRVKVKIGLAKGKKLHDKRQTTMERDNKRALNRALKQDL